MGQPVIHFEIAGKDPGALRSYYSQLFDWNPQVDENAPMEYGVIEREQNLTADGVGIGGGISGAPEGYDGHVTFYVEVPDVEASLKQAEELGGTRMMGPAEPMEGLILGMFSDPENNTIGLIQG